MCGAILAEWRAKKSVQWELRVPSPAARLLPRREPRETHDMKSSRRRRPKSRSGCHHAATLRGRPPRSRRLLYTARRVGESEALKSSVSSNAVSWVSISQAQTWNIDRREVRFRTEDRRHPPSSDTVPVASPGAARQDDLRANPPPHLRQPASSRRAGLCGVSMRNTELAEPSALHTR